MSITNNIRYILERATINTHTHTHTGKHTHTHTQSVTLVVIGK